MNEKLNQLVLKNIIEKSTTILNLKSLLNGSKNIRNLHFFNCTEKLINAALKSCSKDLKNIFFEDCLIKEIELEKFDLIDVTILCGGVNKISLKAQNAITYDVLFEKFQDSFNQTKVEIYRT